MYKDDVRNLHALRVRICDDDRREQGGDKRPDLMGFVFFPMNEWMNEWNTEDEWMDDLYPVHRTLLSYPEYKSFSKSPSNGWKSKERILSMLSVPSLAQWKKRVF